MNRVIVLMSLSAAACGPTTYGARPVAGGGVVPAPAPGQKIEKFEYACVTTGGGDLTQVLNEAGLKGWELETSFTLPTGEVGFCFKRELEFESKETALEDPPKSPVAPSQLESVQPKPAGVE